jgi:hypothetical protein
MTKCALPGTEDMLRRGAGCPVNLESVAGALQCIQLALPRFVDLSNWALCEINVSLTPDGGRKIFAKTSPGNELRAWRCADAKIGDLAWPGGLSTRARAVSWHSQHRKTRKLDTTDWPLVAADLERQLATTSARVVRGPVGDEEEFASPVTLRCMSPQFGFRNDIAHGKSIKVCEVTTLPASTYDAAIHEFAKTDWEKFCTRENAERARAAVEAMVTLLHEKAGLTGESPFMTRSQDSLATYVREGEAQ